MERIKLTKAEREYILQQRAEKVREKERLIAGQNFIRSILLKAPTLDELYCFLKKYFTIKRTEYRTLSSCELHTSTRDLYISRQEDHTYRCTFFDESDPYFKDGITLEKILPHHTIY